MSRQYSQAASREQLGYILVRFRRNLNRSRDLARGGKTLDESHTFFMLCLSSNKAKNISIY